MKKNIINLRSNKSIEAPFRMYRTQEIEAMEADPFYLENSIFVNIIKYGDKIEETSLEIPETTPVLNYIDCSGIEYTREYLTTVIKNQFDSKSDFIILPSFKNETEEDIIEKLNFLTQLKLLTNRDIIFEISYKIDPSKIDWTKYTSLIDLFSIYYGVHYGHYNQISQIVSKFVGFKRITEKPVLVFGTPFLFAGDDRSDANFLPCQDLICDGWIKNWKRAGGGASETKLLDQMDFKSKTYTKWLEKYPENHLIKSINRTVKTLFLDSNLSFQKNYNDSIIDEGFAEVRIRNPKEIENFVLSKFHGKYISLIFKGFKEKLISNFFLEENIVFRFNEKEREALEYKIREYELPSDIDNIMSLVKKLIVNEKNISITQIINSINEHKSSEI